MCGIAGIVHADGRPVDREALEAMTDAMRHRGPDDRGVLVLEGGTGPSVGLGHRRLSILDLSALGRQPMDDGGGALWVVFNGEIYNFRELRAELEALGHRFRSATDTEVVVHALARWGEAALARLDGMFALAAWDARAGRLLLARDRFGKKPLFYHYAGGLLAFASELPALLRHPAVPRAVDPQSLSRYLLHEYVPAPHCLLEGVRKLPAGHALSWTPGASGAAGTARVAPYWTMAFGGNEGISDAEAEAELERLFSRAVRRRLVSDVPLGVFLSGGLDSSAVTAFMAGHVPARSIRTFCIGFAEAGFDESAHARAVARALGTEHHEQTLREADLIDVVPQALGCLPEPMADSSLVPTWLLARFARQEVTVALGGDGGDELFAGYDPFLALGPARLAAWAPRPLLALAGRAAALGRASEGNMSPGFRVRQFLRGVGRPVMERNQLWLGAFDLPGQRAVLHPDVLARLGGFDPLDEVAEAGAQGPQGDDVQRTVAFYLRYYMAGHILPKVDAAGMAHSLEVRAPFLDTALAEFACSLPSRMKLRGLTRKWLPRRMLRGRLPAPVLARGKKGFGIPLAKWLKGGLRGMAEELLAEDRLRRGGLLEPRTVRGLLTAHLRGERDNRKELWTLLCLQHWLAGQGLG
jgi:asparagine synthase (glutamine-hydrolysing)